MTMQPGDTVTYWVNYRANGTVGGWQRAYRTGMVVAVRRTTALIKRAIIRPMADHNVHYGYYAKPESVPLARITSVNA